MQVGLSPVFVETISLVSFRRFANEPFPGFPGLQESEVLAVRCLLVYLLPYSFADL